MKGIDTNILIRLAVADNPAQTAAARELVKSASKDQGVFISAITIVETVWSLKRLYGFESRKIAQFLGAILRVDGISVEFGSALGMLLESGTDPHMIADHFVSLSGQRAGCSSTATFDKRAAHDVAGMELVN